MVVGFHMFLSALTVKIIIVNMNLAGSADSLEQRFQRDVNYLFVAAGSQQRYPARAPHASASARSHLGKAWFRRLLFCGGI